MTIVETMVAAVILSAGVLGVFVMVEVADSIHRANSGRETATNLARELLENARSTPYASVGDTNWFNSTLTALDGRSSNVVSPTSHSARTTVDRRGFSYSVDVDTCSVDDGRDGYGAHSGAVNWCSDSSSTASGDSAPEDLKRVAVTIGWTEKGKTFTTYQTATFSSAGAVIGPYVSEFKITTPPGLDPTEPIITTNPTNGNVIFQATSVGAADMRFSVDGVEQTSGVSGGSGGTWTYTWNITNLKDGVYAVGATAIDALGVRGDPQVIQVRLARGAPTPASNVTGGYNDVYVSGVKTRVVELAWDASPDGGVTGYEVWKGTTNVCTASLAIECIDLNPAMSGSTTYTVKTLYNDAAGNPGSVSTTYDLTAPTGATVPSRYGFKTSTSYVGLGICGTAAYNKKDLWHDFVTSGGTATKVLYDDFFGCSGPLPSGAIQSGTAVTATVWFDNTNNKDCVVGGALYKNSTLLLAWPSVWTVPRNTTTAVRYTATGNIAAGTLSAGDTVAIAYSFNDSPDCKNTSFYYGSGTRQSYLDLPITGGGSGVISPPAVPTAPAVTANADGTRTVTWTAPSGTPAPEFYRVYRDGRNYTDRYDTIGASGTSMSWTDTSTGGSSHTYRVTAVSTALAESDFAGPVTG